MYCIFDLDGTLIDSSHRQLTKPNGDLDLDHWIENCTRKKVLRDSLLPMIDVYHRERAANNFIMFCTARVLGSPDHEFFASNGLLADHIISRPNGCTTNDALLKEIQLRMFAHERGITWRDFCSNAIMYDDNQNVISHMSQNGLTVHNAKLLNRSLAA